MNIEMNTRQFAKELNDFFSSNKARAHNYLHARYSSLSDETIEDLYQEASIALYTNIIEGKAENLTCSLFTYFISICNNLAMKESRKTIYSIDIDDNRNGIFTGESEDGFIEEKISILEELVGYADISDEDEIHGVEWVEEKIREGVKNMKSPCDKILWSYYWDNMSYKDISDLYSGIDGFKNDKVVKTEASRCRNKFSMYLQSLNIKL